ncbi:MAG: manganese transporter permease, partial [Candidatus Competibacterales bacterium]
VPWGSLGLAIALVWSGFLQLRILDEFKDAASDARHRPEHPITRGVIALPALGLLASGLGILQLLLVLALHPPLVGWLLAVWGYAGLMSAEFFVPRWLRARRGVYLVSHLAIVPLLALLASACHWQLVGLAPPGDLGALLLLSLANGAVVEVGRKTWAPAQERPGVASYSAAWGIPRALGVWLVAATAALGSAAVIAGGWGPVAVLLTIGWGLLVSLALALGRHPTALGARRLYLGSGAWVVASYGAVGWGPWVRPLAGGGW